MEDVWISPAVGTIPCWVEDQDVRDGICAMLKCNHCLEEQRRLGIEADNLCRWYGAELAAVELALCTRDSWCCITFTVSTHQKQTIDEFFYLALREH